MQQLIAQPRPKLDADSGLACRLHAGGAGSIGGVVPLHCGGGGIAFGCQRYTDAIINYCETLKTSRLRGTRRDDIRLGLRITNYKGRAIIAFVVSDTRVSIIGVFYGGQDYETELKPADADPDHDGDATQ